MNVNRFIKPQYIQRLLWYLFSSSSSSLLAVLLLSTSSEGKRKGKDWSFFVGDHEGDDGGDPALFLLSRDNRILGAMVGSPKSDWCDDNIIIIIIVFNFWLDNPKGTPRGLDPRMRGQEKLVRGWKKSCGAYLLTVERGELQRSSRHALYLILAFEFVFCMVPRHVAFTKQYLRHFWTVSQRSYWVLFVSFFPAFL